MITKTFIENAIKNNFYRITTHATQRRLERAISLNEIKQILLTGEIITFNNQAFPYPTATLLGFLPSGDPIHVVISQCKIEPQLRIVTVYEPDAHLWDNSYKNRKRK